MSVEDQPAVRHSFLLEPGEGWLLSPDLFAYVDRFSEFMEASGLTDEQFIVSPVVSIPIPSVDAMTSVLRTWSAVHPEMMWHPFFWLPDAVSSRVLISDVSGDRLESDEEYLVRVMAQCTLSGLFDVETGTWLDVLAQAGLDLSSDAELDRVEAWQAGGDDDLLDSIDLSRVFTEADAYTESETVLEASASTASNVKGQWALTADYIGRSVRDMQSADPQPTVSEYAEVIGTFLVLAYSGFAGGALISDFETREQVQQLILDTQVEAADFQVIGHQLLSICAQAYVAHKPALDQLGAEADEVEQAYRGLQD